MVKLVNFFDFASLNNLRHQMGAELVKEFKFDSGISLLEDGFLEQLDGDGLEIESLNEIEFNDDKTLVYKGQRVLIYIRDVNVYHDQVRLPKFHISTCDTLVKMWKRKRSERYVLYRRENGIFKLNIMRKPNDLEVKQEKLDVCRNCLNNLNWNNYSEDKSQRTNIVNEFTISDFFSKYPKSLISVKPKYNSDTAPLNTYSKNWSDISQKMKKQYNYQCQNCQIDLVGKFSKFLHVHHIDGQKNNNEEFNLKVLCVRCHANEPQHGHMKASQDYKSFVTIYNQLVIE